jgi:hypothetical protein
MATNGHNSAVPDLETNNETFATADEFIIVTRQSLNKNNDSKKNNNSTRSNAFAGATTSNNDDDSSFYVLPQSKLKVQADAVTMLHSLIPLHQ